MVRIEHRYTHKIKHLGVIASTNATIYTNLLVKEFLDKKLQKKDVQMKNISFLVDILVKDKFTMCRKIFLPSKFTIFYLILRVNLQVMSFRGHPLGMCFAYNGQGSEYCTISYVPCGAYCRDSTPARYISISYSTQLV